MMLDLRLEDYYAEPIVPSPVGWSVLLDEPRTLRDTAAVAMLRRLRLVRAETPVSVARVINPSHGEEARGYLFVEEDGERRAYLRGPCWTGHWVELDRALAAALICVVVPYNIKLSGDVSYFQGTIERQEGSTC